MFSMTPIGWIAAGMLVVIVALGGYCKLLKVENDAYKLSNSALSTSLSEKTSALELCSKNTQALADADKQVTAAALVAVNEARDQAKQYYDNASKLLNGKVIVPPITKDNIKNYGGVDPVARTTDCNAAHQLLNDYMDTRTARKATK